MGKTGYIQLSRRFFDTEEWRETRVFSRADAWLDMIQMAAYKSVIVDVQDTSLDRSTDRIELLRGEIFASQRYLAARWNWSATKVRSYLNTLACNENPRIEFLTRKPAKKPANEPLNKPTYKIIKLCNYDRYNPIPDDKKPANEPANEPAKKSNIIKYIERNNENHTQSLLENFSRECAYSDARAIARTRELTALLLGINDLTHTHEWRGLAKPIKCLLWIWGNFADLQLRFKNPLILWQAQQLCHKYEYDDITRIVEAMANKQSIASKNSFYWTFKAYAAQDFIIAKKQKLGNIKYSKNYEQ